MSDLTSASPSPAGSGTGLAPTQSGIPDAAPSGSVGPSTPGRDIPASSAPSATIPATPPAAAPETDWKKRHDDSRAEYQRLVSELGGDPKQAAQHLQVLYGLVQQPWFQEAAQRALAAKQAGTDDPETVKALQLVDQRAQQVAARLIAPLQAKELEQRKEAIGSAMTQKYGPEWQTHKPKMLELYQRDVQRGYVDARRAEYGFDQEYVEGLYARAVGTNPAYAAQQHARRLEALRTQTTTAQPGTAPSAVGTGKINSFDDAFQAAKRQLGLA